MKNKITAEAVAAWIGESATREQYAQLLSDIASGAYPLPLFVNEVNDYWEGINYCPPAPKRKPAPKRARRRAR